MPEIVIPDTSCLIVLDNIEELGILHKVYGSITITPEVAEEFSSSLPNWINIRTVIDKKYLESLQTQVDLGEASIIALAKEFDSPLLLIDDLKARKLALKLNLKFTGTLGLIHKACQMGFVPNVSPIIQKLISAGFRISDNIINDLLLKNNEH
jgi:predicted nucleic acid-binding protein